MVRRTTGRRSHARTHHYIERISASCSETVRAIIQMSVSHLAAVRCAGARFCVCDLVIIIASAARSVRSPGETAKLHERPLSRVRARMPRTHAPTDRSRAPTVLFRSADRPPPPGFGSAGLTH